MTIAVLGLGGIGGYIGAKLCALKNEHTIVFLTRGKHLEQIQNHGLKLIDNENTDFFHPSLATQTYEDAIDILFLCTKSYSYETALKTYASCINENTHIVVLANGVNNVANVKKLTPAKVSTGSVYIISHKHDDGVIKKVGSKFLLMYGDLSLTALFEKTELNARVSHDIEKDIWKKFLFIATFATLTSYYEFGMGSIYRDHLTQATELMHEILDIAQALNVNLTQEHLDKALATASTLPLEAPTSMWLDLQNHKQSEIASLCGYIVSQAQELDMSVPLMQTLYFELKQKYTL